MNILVALSSCEHSKKVDAFENPRYSCVNYPDRRQSRRNPIGGTAASACMSSTKSLIMAFVDGLVRLVSNAYEVPRQRNQKKRHVRKGKPEMARVKGTTHHRASNTA